MASYRNKTLEEIVDEWSNELEMDVLNFTRQAIDVSKWDKLIMANNQKIIDLNKSLNSIQGSQVELDQRLDVLLSQQDELSLMLDKLESDISSLPQTDQNPVDIERSKTYDMVEEIDLNLSQMSSTIKEIIERMNSVRSTESEDSPVKQIVKILNLHLNSLQWIDQQSEILNAKIADLNKVQSTAEINQQRLAYKPYPNF